MIMPRLQFFVTMSVVIFVVERILPLMVSWPIFIFPVLAILFMLTSKNEAREMSYIVIASLFFDFFSGYIFGWATLIILAVVLIIFFFKTRFNVSSQPILSLAIYTLIFTFVYFAILSVKSDLRFMTSQSTAIIIETLILFLIFNFTFRKLVKTA
ncbi:MAG: hypothetical protein A2831_01640 [Candidatus Yanofskybacteria bacterium RIFCSPHIGHO2_01_FULL_44_17]|uniref:Rod shape-determining protein MreD n=1 Tax=Candidatus Yanofskybacteria bacterium RIFCSPHIGHO2_01_FULL_44_17 TaxID=1802668 RepID=A0A1F8EWD1_9BACT|nr:MAG: hypothetical protein A2831_01640 [Candidatus Yanofskybacteria bacterium RIFCSPHIGHO2_01_FULL_44_17]